MKKTLTLIAALFLMTSCTYAKTQNLLCLSASASDGLMVYLDTTHHQLIINGEPHNYVTVMQYNGDTAIHTENFISIESKLSYITLTSIDRGKHAGMYLALYDSNYATPTAIVPMRCQHYAWEH